MYRGIFVSLAIAIVISSAALAGNINQGQTLWDSLSNGLSLNGGIGYGSFLGYAQTPQMTQTANKNDAWAVQHQSGLLTQSGSASELVAFVSVSEGLVGGGPGNALYSQLQNINDSGGAKTQLSYLGVSASQNFSTVNGPAWGQATNTAILSQDQQAGNVVGNMSESSGITAVQMGFISGTPGTVGILNGGLTTVAAQSQVVN
jgi:hypothetical protein